jgi:hypothetical protein
MSTDRMLFLGCVLQVAGVFIVAISLALIAWAILQ